MCELTFTVVRIYQTLILVMKLLCCFCVSSVHQSAVGCISRRGVDGLSVSAWNPRNPGTGPAESMIKGGCTRMNQ